MGNFTFNAENFKGFDFATSNTFAQALSGKATAERKSTAGQHKYYIDLCTKKGLKAKSATELIALNYDEMSNLLDETIKYQAGIAPSQSQLDLIQKICTRNGWNVLDKVPNFNSLTGGREGSASKAIEELFEAEKLNRENMPPTDKQLQAILGMYTCPDVDFSELGWQDKFEVIDGRNFIVQPSAVELAQFIFEHCNIQKASDFIAKYGTISYAWKQTRLNINQANFIRTLEARMADIYVPRVAGADKQMLVNAYTPLNDLQLNQLSVEQADAYIKQLQKELADSELIKFSQDKHDSWEINRILKGTEKVAKEYEDMRNLIHSLYAALGEDVTEEEELMVTTLADVDNPQNEKYKNMFKELLQRIVEQGAMSVENLMETIQENKVAMAILY